MQILIYLVWGVARDLASPPVLLACGPHLEWQATVQASWGHASSLSHFSLLSSQMDTGKTFQAVMRFDTDVELTYFYNGGILNYMIRKMAK